MTERAKLNIEIDKVIYARQREWSGVFSHDKFVLRGLIYGVVKTFADEQAKKLTASERRVRELETFVGFVSREKGSHTALAKEMLHKPTPPTDEEPKP